MQTVVGRRTVDLLASELRALGTRRIYGLPGGGSNTDLIDAAADAGIDFVLTHTEGAAAFMSAAEGELTGRPGVCLATLGPGAASMANGLAHALLDRAPLLLFTDRHPDSARARFQHQTLDHETLLRPVTKWSTTLEPATALFTFREALRICLHPPAGPVHLDLSTPVGQAEAALLPAPSPTIGQATAIDGAGLAAARDIVEAGRRPALLVGLAARDDATARAVRAFAVRFGLPVLSTYKGKGVFPERHELAAGIVTNGVIEDLILGRADVVLAVGLDSVELLPRPWRWSPPLIVLTPVPLDQRHVPSSVELRGEPSIWLAALAEELAATGFASAWTVEEIATCRREMERQLQLPAEGGLAPWRVVQVARAAAPPGTIATVDAGSHMFPSTIFWTADEPRSFLISNGLSTMGYALPAAIAASLVRPEQPVVCLTGDGGLSINVSELETAARLRARVVVVVFNDGALSLIKIKQEEKAAIPRGLDFAPVDWAKIADGFGVRAERISSEAELERALAEAMVASGPVLIDVPIDARTHLPTLRAIRG